MKYPKESTGMINVLIVDDDAAARKTFGNILKAKGYDVEDAGSGEDAISLANAKFFNIVFIDIRLPGMSGLEALQAMRVINEDTVEIMATAYASLDSSIEAMNKGAYSYITKPVNMDDVLTVIDKALEKQRLSTENKRLLVQLREANKRLEELDKRKSDFVDRVSHEFRSPLGIVKNSLAVVLGGLAGEVSPEQKRLLDAGKRNIDRLIRLINDLLDLSKIEAGKMEMKRSEIGAARLAEERLANFRESFGKKNIILKKDIPADVGTVWGDEDKIIEVIDNLLANAMKYTPPGGTVTFTLSGNEQEVRFAISDTGPGIAKEDIEKIFDKFERVSAERQEGTGLGLPIAKDIVNLHKGKIWVESAIGKGSTFLFTLPRNLRR